jgi:serine/threonine-protein kinase
MAVPFDPDELAVTGPPRAVLEGIWNGVPALFAISGEGDLAYAPQPQVSEGQGPSRQLVWVDRSGTEEPVDSALPAQGFRWVALSPDDRRLATVIIRDPHQNLWVKELPDGPLTRLTTSEVIQSPVWTPDGEHIGYISLRGAGDSIPHARTIRADGSSSGRSEVLVRRRRPVFQVLFAPVRPALVIREGDVGMGEADLGLVDLETDSVREDLLATPYNERAADLSPDGRWMAYVSDISGRDEVYVRPFPSVEDDRWQVSSNGGLEPLWAHNGHELFYREPVRSSMAVHSGPMMVATYTTDPSFRIEGREPLFDAGEYLIAQGDGVPYSRAYDVTSDDQRFVMIRTNADTGGSVPTIVVVENFVEELKDTFGND